MNQYKNDDPLYPNDPTQRSLVDEMMHFDSNTFLTRINNIFVSIIIQEMDTTSNIYLSLIHQIHFMGDQN